MRELTASDHELIAYARQIVDGNTDGDGGVHTMGAAVRGADGGMYGGINLYHFRSVRITDLMPYGGVWTVDEGTQPFDPEVFR
ncbi:hypothetical protein [Asanoa hainanensis]|nr:hypothetical protein [Asanoa hainanensis]